MELYDRHGKKQGGNDRRARIKSKSMNLLWKRQVEADNWDIGDIEERMV